MLTCELQFAASLDPQVDLRNRFEIVQRVPLEGIVAKDPKSPYVEGPTETWHWQKIKNRDYKRQGKEEFRRR